MGATNTPLPHYQHAPPTKENLVWANLAIIDLAKASTAEGRAELAPLARDAMRNIGFFYVVNHGLSQAEVDRVFDIADLPFSQTSDSEKQEYSERVLETGSYQGYKARQYWHLDGGVYDQIEGYTINRDVYKKQHPPALRPFLPELSEFTKHNHSIVHTLLRLLAVGLELPEDTFVDKHNWAADGETNVRFMKYHPRSQEEEDKSNQVWLKGHTDIGSISILWSQPVAGLQILSREGDWKWIRHIDNALIINTGDCLQFLSGGFYTPTIHRVIQPPVDQRGHTRLGVYYFSMPDDDVQLAPIGGLSASEALRARLLDGDFPTVNVWRKGRTRAHGKTELKKSQEKGVEEEIISGVVVKHYS
ncbi:Clavaminate synthase-like protein [Trametopsis cervina]|nr:Clavaminate synthase-like protein [Trametopsis cervina]